MKLTALLSTLAITSFTTAWNLDIYGTDGRHVNFHGTENTGCIDISFTPVIDVKQANFNPATPWWPDPTTFDLYRNKGCEGLSYRNGGGSHALTPARDIRSYKVYGESLLRVKRDFEDEVKREEGLFGDHA